VRKAVEVQVKCYSRMGNILFAKADFPRALEMYNKRVHFARQQVSMLKM